MAAIPAVAATSLVSMTDDGSQVEVCHVRSKLMSAVLAVLFLASACSSGTTPAPTTGAAPGGAGSAGKASVTVANFAFSPASLTVSVGTTVTWTNQDPTAHTVTSDDGSSFDGQLPASGTFSFTFTKPGTYPYHCAIHPNMKGTIVVR